MAVSFKDFWKKAKKEYEDNTGKKKPSEKVWGVFRKSTGIESALEECDKAKTPDAMRAANKKYDTAKNEYLKLLYSTIKDEKIVNIQAEGEKLRLALENISTEISVRANDLQEGLTRDESKRKELLNYINDGKSKIPKFVLENMRPPLVKAYEELMQLLDKKDFKKCEEKLKLAKQVLDKAMDLKMQHDKQAALKKN